MPSWLDLAIHEIKQTYGDDVWPKGKSLLKFGQADALGTSEETIWQRGFPYQWRRLHHERRVFGVGQRHVVPRPELGKR